MADTTKKQYLDLVGAGVLVDNMKGYVDAEVNTLDQAIHGVDGSLTAEIANRKAAVKAEEDRAKAAEKVNADAIAAEKTRAEGVEAELQAAIDAIEADTTVADALNAEIARAKAAEEANAAAIVKEAEDRAADVDAEEQRAIAKENELAQAIADEAARADAAEKANAQALAEEIARAKAAEEANAAAAAAQADIDAFMNAAEVGEAAVDTLKEIQAYIESDGAAAAKMTEDIAANKKAIEDEVARATGVENGLDERLVAVEGLLGEGGDVDERIADAIDALDSDATKEAGADGLALEVHILNGKLTGISGSIAAETYDAFGAAAAAQTAATEAAAEDATEKANTAEANAKAYADELDANIEAIPTADIEALFAPKAD